jgi:hypothetical protein
MDEYRDEAVVKIRRETQKLLAERRAEKYKSPDDIITGAGEVIDENYDKRNIKKWCQGRKTMRIGTKYIDIEDLLFKEAVNVSSCGEALANASLNLYMNEYAIDPRKLIAEVVGIAADVDIKCLDNPSNAIVCGRLTDEPVPSFVTHNEDICYDFWKKLTGVPFNIFTKNACGTDRIKKGSREDAIIYHIKRSISRSLYNIFEEIHPKLVEYYTPVPVVCEYLTNTNLFAAERKRYELYRNYLKYIAGLFERENYEYLQQFDDEQLQQRWYFPLDYQLEAAKNYTDSLHTDDKEATRTALYEDFMTKVFDPVFSREQSEKILKKLYTGDVVGNLTACDAVYHLNDNDFWDEAENKKAFLKKLDEENPLAKYELSPGLQAKVSDTGYDGVGEERYYDGVFGVKPFNAQRYICSAGTWNCRILPNFQRYFIRRASKCVRMRLR